MSRPDPSVPPDGRGFRSTLIQARGVTVEFDLDLGQLVRFEVVRGGRVAAPFHRAPWADDPYEPAAAEPPHLARLSGDFFCAPFGASDVEPGPLHGWSANGTWQLLHTSHRGPSTSVTFELDAPILGARLRKELTVVDDHPFLYQRHTFEGGSGALPVASHAMVRLPNGAELSWSPKRWAESPDAPLETDPARGRSVLQYPAIITDPSRFPTRTGGHVDLTRYPVDEGHEDFVMLVELSVEPGLGWTAVQQPQGVLALTLKNRAVLPVTMLWLSNGGRYYPPWSGRHVGVLGVEDGCTYSAAGHRASTDLNPLAAAGVPTSVSLDGDGPVEIRHVLGATTLAAGGRVAEVTTGEGTLVVTLGDGVQVELPFDTDFLQY